VLGPAQLVALYSVGFATNVLYPADPSWIASQKLHDLRGGRWQPPPP
jgi:hypothetical protein